MARGRVIKHVDVRCQKQFMWSWGSVDLLPCSKSGKAGKSVDSTNRAGNRALEAKAGEYLGFRYLAEHSCKLTLSTVFCEICSLTSAWVVLSCRNCQPSSLHAISLRHQVLEWFPQRTVRGDNRAPLILNTRSSQKEGNTHSQQPRKHTLTGIPSHSGGS